MAFEDIHRPLGAAGFRGTIRAMIIISGIFLILQQFFGSTLNQYLGLVPDDVLRRGFVWQVFTYIFLHGGIFHWLFNMFIFWMFGRELEVRWGRPTFIRYCLWTAFAAALCVLIVAPRSTVPTIGSSGIVFGLLVAFAMTFPQSTMYLYFLIPMKTWQVAILFGVIELLTALNSSNGPASWAHLGGMVAGFLYFYVPRLRTFSWRLPSFRREKKVDLHVLTDNLASEVDRILDKILKNGVNSLTAEEKEIMERYAKKKR